MIVPCRELMPVIRSALERGQRVRMTVNGASMSPFIRDGDVVELEPMHSLPITGDILLVHCSVERYVLHRVSRVEGEVFFLRGDAQAHEEGPFTRGDLLGRVVKTYGNGRVRAHDCGAWRLAGLAWVRSTPLGIWLLRLCRRLRRGMHPSHSARIDDQQPE